MCSRPQWHRSREAERREVGEKKVRKLKKNEEKNINHPPQWQLMS
jgi:hypothetical protein